MKKIIFVVSLMFSVSIFAAPSEVIMIRHADKWAKKNAGPFLSPTGQLRAEKFASYYLKNFPTPDFIFASKSSSASEANSEEGGSMRPLQTVAPLANQLAFNHHRGFFVNMNYKPQKFGELAQTLLHNKLYDRKIILICWHHGKMNEFAKVLGVTATLPHWMGKNYDSVYVLKYNAAGKLTSFENLTNQYPVPEQATWRDN